MADATEVTGSTKEALLDATERVLVDDGQAAVSTRRIAEEAGVAHGLIRYHFGSLDNLMRETVDRASKNMIARQEALYTSDVPFLEKWRTAMDYWETDLDDGFPKLLAELLARGWNDPSWHEPIQHLSEAFTDMLEIAIASAVDEYQMDGVDVRAMAVLLRTFQTGVLIDRVGGIDHGHAHLNAVIKAWLEQQAATAGQSDAREDA